MAWTQSRTEQNASFSPPQATFRGDKPRGLPGRTVFLMLLARIVVGLASGKFGFSLIRAAELPPPQFDWISVSTTNGLVLLHFYTDPIRGYEIQYIDSIPTNGATWSRLGVIEANGAAQHYAYPDFLSPTRKQRFYRLKATF